MVETIKIVCRHCGRAMNTPRCDTDPPTAVELRGIACPECDTGGFDMPEYYDANGTEVDADPMKFMEASK